MNTTGRDGRRKGERERETAVPCRECGRTLTLLNLNVAAKRNSSERLLRVFKECINLLTEIMFYEMMLTKGIEKGEDLKHMAYI